MSIRLLSAIGAALWVLTRVHLTVTTAGGVGLSVYVPVLIVAVMALVLAAGVLVIVRHLRSFRSSPYPRPRLVESTRTAPYVIHGRPA